MLCCIQDWLLVMNFLELQLGFSISFSTQVVLLNVATFMEMYLLKRVLKSLLITTRLTIFTRCLNLSLLVSIFEKPVFPKLRAS